MYSFLNIDKIGGQETESHQPEVPGPVMAELKYPFAEPGLVTTSLGRLLKTHGATGCQLNKCVYSHLMQFRPWTNRKIMHAKKKMPLLSAKREQ